MAVNSVIPGIREAAAGLPTAAAYLSIAMRLLSPRETDSYIRAFSFKRTTSRSGVTEFPSAAQGGGSISWTSGLAASAPGADTCCSTVRRMSMLSPRPTACDSIRSKGMYFARYPGVSALARFDAVIPCCAARRSSTLPSPLWSLSNKNAFMRSPPRYAARAQNTRVSNSVSSAKPLVVRSRGISSRVPRMTQGRQLVAPASQPRVGRSGFALPCRRLTGR